MRVLVVTIVMWWMSSCAWASCESLLITSPGGFLGVRGEVFRTEDGRVWLNVGDRADWLHEVDILVEICDEELLTFNRQEYAVRVVGGCD